MTMDGGTHPDPSPPAVDPGIVGIRGRQVLLDQGLANVYGVSTKALNQAVKRNAERFPDDFAFRLTADELAALRSQIVTSNAGRGGRRYPPLVFTEQGGDHDRLRSEQFPGDRDECLRRASVRSAARPCPYECRDRETSRTPRASRDGPRRGSEGSVLGHPGTSSTRAGSAEANWLSYNGNVRNAPNRWGTRAARLLPRLLLDGLVAMTNEAGRAGPGSGAGSESVGRAPEAAFDSRTLRTLPVLQLEDLFHGNRDRLGSPDVRA